MNKFTPAIDSLKELNAYQLAGMADTHSPDSLESDGAEFLTGIRDSVVEQLHYYSSGDYAELESPAELIDSVQELDTFSSEIPDGAPSIYTHRLFQQLVDLCAYQEDIDDLTGGMSVDMATMAGYALYQVAERLVSALLGEVAEFELEDED